VLPPSHAAARPWRGRNALRAVELMNIGWDLNREQLRPERRSHYVITDGGDQPNVIPSRASVWYFFREAWRGHKRTRRGPCASLLVPLPVEGMTFTRV
jgi:metal-dependent amidase/aminoacylase/carboxypeptidase family protein